MKHFWLSFLTLLFSVGISAAGFYFRDEALVVSGLICASFNASVYSACIATTLSVTHKHIIVENESEVISDVSS